MKKKLSLLTAKAFVIGMCFAFGFVASTAIAITISATFSDGDTLTASALNELKTTLTNLPNWGKGDTATDAVFTDGKVGIGMTNPRTALDINGSLSFVSQPLNDGTTDVSVSNLFHIDASTNATITAFANGIQGQEITIFVNGEGGNVTIKHDPNKIYFADLFPSGNPDFVSSWGHCDSEDVSMFKFIYLGSVWYELHRFEILSGC